MRQNYLLEVIVRYYQDVVPTLAQAHGIVYPAELEQIMLDRLSELDTERG